MRTHVSEGGDFPAADALSIGDDFDRSWEADLEARGHLAAVGFGLGDGFVYEDSAPPDSAEDGVGEVEDGMEVLRALGMLRELISSARLAPAERQLLTAYLPIAFSRAEEGSSHIARVLLDLFVESVEPFRVEEES